MQRCVYFSDWPKFTASYTIDVLALKVCVNAHEIAVCERVFFCSVGKLGADAFGN